MYRGPVCLKNCLHIFCCSCLAKQLEGRLLKSLTCPICKEAFDQKDVVSSLSTLSILGTLQIKCKQQCGEKYSISEKYELINHENVCSGPEKPFRLLDILNIDESSGIPREVEKAAYHVVKLKMASSSEPSKGIKFHSGGPRVKT